MLSPALAPALPTPRRPSGSHAARPPQPFARGDRTWQLVADETSVRVVSAGSLLGEARVSEPDDRVVIEFWVDPSGLPGEATAQLVAQAFARPAVRPRRRVLVCVPKRDGAVHAHVQRLVTDAVVRPAGVTCLIAGRVAATATEEPENRCPAT